MDGVGCRPGCDARPRRVRRQQFDDIERRTAIDRRRRVVGRQFYDDPNGVDVNRDCGVLRRERRDHSDRIGDDLRQVVLGRQPNDASERIHDERGSGLLECRHHADSDRVDVGHGDGVRRRIDDSPKHLERTHSPTDQGGGVLAAAVPPRAAGDHAAGTRARGRHRTRYPVLM